MAFGDVKQDFYPPYDADDVGGVSSRIWVASRNEGVYYETESSGSLIKEQEPYNFFGEVVGAGGSGSVVWALESPDDTKTEIYEASPSDFSRISVGENLYLNYESVGGDSNNIYASVENDKIDKLSPSDYSVLQTATVDYPRGIGGDDVDVWVITRTGTGSYIRNLSPSDFSVLRTGDQPDGSETPEAVGGSQNVIWCVSNTFDIQELELPTVPPDAPTNLTATLQ